jgi:hypothetical protein
MNKLRPILLQQVSLNKILLVDARKIKMDRNRENLLGTYNQNQLLFIAGEGKEQWSASLFKLWAVRVKHSGKILIVK